MGVLESRGGRMKGCNTGTEREFCLAQLTLRSVIPFVLATFQVFRT